MLMSFLAEICSSARKKNINLFDLHIQVNGAIKNSNDKFTDKNEETEISLSSINNKQRPQIQSVRKLNDATTAETDISFICTYDCADCFKSESCPNDKCIKTFHLKSDSTNWKGDADQKCEDGYYYKDNKGACVICGCKDGKCDSAKTTGECQADVSCISGYYIDEANGNKCDNCEANCKTCDDKNTCSICNDGFYKNNDVCVKCSTSCEDCFTNKAQCKEAVCKALFNLADSSQDCSGTSPSTDCKDGYYFKTATEGCVKCVADNCKTCASNICSMCNDGFYLDKSTNQNSPNCVKCIYDSTKTGADKVCRLPETNGSYKDTNDLCKGFIPDDR